MVLAITTTGTVKVWTLLGNENKYSEPIYENESKEVSNVDFYYTEQVAKIKDISFQIRCLNAITLSCCSQNQRTVLIVCAKYWQIYDAGKIIFVCFQIKQSK